MVIGNVNGFSTKYITLMGTGHKHDAIGNTKGQLSLAVHECSYRQVGQREQCPTLTHMAAIQVICRYRHDSNSMLFVYFRNLTTCICCKAVGTIE